MLRKPIITGRQRKRRSKERERKKMKGRWEIIGKEFTENLGYSSKESREERFQPKRDRKIP